LAGRQAARPSAALACQQALESVDRGRLSLVYFGYPRSSGVNRVQVGKSDPAELLDALRPKAIYVAHGAGYGAARRDGRGQGLLCGDPALAFLRTRRPGKVRCALGKRPECRIAGFRLCNERFKLRSQSDADVG
jgi:hypothetical protein